MNVSSTIYPDERPSQILAKAKHPAGEKTVVVAVDGSRISLHALEWAIQHYAKERDYLVLVNVREGRQDLMYEVWQGDFLADAADMEVFDERNYAYSKALLLKMGKHLDSKGYQHYSLHSLLGEPRQELTKFVNEDIQPDAAVIGQRGLGRLSTMLLGSVSEYLVKNAKCPVIVVPKAIDEPQKV